MLKRLFSILALTLVAAPLTAQDPLVETTAGGGDLLDRVVAVVGDTVVLLSEVQEEILRLQSAGQFPSDPAAQEQTVELLLDAQVEQLLLLTAAKRAGMSVAENQVEELVDQNLASVQERFGSEAAFQSALEESGLTLNQYRRQLIQQQRAELLRQRYVASQLRGRAPPLISEDQIRRVFEQQRGSLGERPAMVTIEQVIVRPEPTDSARAAAHRRAEQALQELAEGADFEVLARRYSDDKGSAEQGGDLGWFQRDRMVPEFSNVAFVMRPGQTSGIVESEFGFHIIRVERVRGPERQARHILFQPEITEADIQRARQRADSVADALREGASARELARQYETPANEAVIEDLPVDRLPPAYAQALEGVGEGEVVSPVELPGGGAPRFAAVRLAERTTAGEFTLDDVRDRIRQRLEEQAMVRELVEELRETIYVRVAL